MFLENKYLKIYTNIIDKARSRNHNTREEAIDNMGYVERHHIIPKSLGGHDDIDNLVYLTAREHFVCHMILVRITSGSSKRKMIFALNKMMRSSETQQRHFPKSHQYEQLPIKFSISISEELKGKKKRPLSESHKISLSNSMTGVPKTQDTINKMISSWNDKDRKQKLIDRNIEKGTLKELWINDSFRNRMSKQVSERQKIRLSNDNILKETVDKLNSKKICDICGISTNIGNYKRWHGANCKKTRITT